MASELSKLIEDEIQRAGAEAAGPTARGGRTKNGYTAVDIDERRPGGSSSSSAGDGLAPRGVRVCVATVIVSVFVVLVLLHFLYRKNGGAAPVPDVGLSPP
eukprot:jgi/Mesvir1/7639/Mv02068-RA.1